MPKPHGKLYLACKLAMMIAGSVLCSSAALAQGFLDNTNLIDVQSGGGLSGTVRSVSHGGYELSDGSDVHQSFAQGDYYGRQLRMRISSSGSPGPRNFGYLRNNTNGSNELRDALAAGNPEHVLQKVD